MSAITQVILVLVLFSCEQVHSYSVNSCSNCMSFKSCPGALFLATYKQSAETKQLFQSSFCGFVFDDEENTDVVKVCCGMFPEPDPIETHPNRVLLPVSCGDLDGDRIIGGNVSGLTEFPWMTLISHETADGLRFECGGTVINSRYILTAAHCVVGFKIAGVRVGEYDQRYLIDCVGDVKRRCNEKYQDIGVEEALPHENYQHQPNVINDIALLRLKKNINLTFRNARPVCLPVTADLRQLDTSGRNSTVTGWGYADNGYISPVLLKVHMPVISRADCAQKNKKFYSGGDNFDKFCAGAPGRDSCGGDSGGPLMIQAVYNDVLRNVQYGIVSYGPRQCGSTQFGVYTDVTKFMDWILQKLKP